MKPQKTPLTLIELLVVIAVVMLLPAIITASLGTARNLAKIPLCANNLRQIGAAVYEYAQIFDGNLLNVRMPAHISPSGSDEVHPYVAYRLDHTVIPGSNQLLPYRLACLYEAGLINDPSLFYCPANENTWFVFKSYNNPQPWGALPQVWNTEGQMNQWVRCGYEWFPVDKNPELQPFRVWGLPHAPKRLCRKFDNLDPNLPYCSDVLRYTDRFSHSYDQVVGLNVLYSDGRVFFQDDPNIFTHRVWDLDPSGYTAREIMAIYYCRILLLAAQLGGTE